MKIGIRLPVRAAGLEAGAGPLHPEEETQCRAAVWETLEELPPVTEDRVRAVLKDHLEEVLPLWIPKQEAG